MMPGRRWLHQALETGASKISAEDYETLASITFQNYFRMYEKLAGMTGTALTEADEFLDVYDLDVLEVPTNMPLVRIERERRRGEGEDPLDHRADRGLQAARPAGAGRHHVNREIPSSSRQCARGWLGGARLLRSVELAAPYSGDDGATKTKVFAILNARYHEQEAYMVTSRAGVPGAIAVATNMAGRGTDIQIGGDADMRIRQRSPTSPIGRRATRSRGARRMRKQVARLKEKALQAAACSCCGTERHKSRRIDNQLRGRSGTKATPGHSKFFLSLEDDLMRVFAAARRHAAEAGAEGKRGDCPSLDPTRRWKRRSRRSRRVTFDIRKNLLKYDNVMNDQRAVIFKEEDTGADAR